MKVSRIGSFPSARTIRTAARLLAAVLLAVLLAAPAAAAAQQPGRSDSLATLRLTVRGDDGPLQGVLVRSADLTPPVAAQSDARGAVVIALPSGGRTLVASRLGFATDTLRLVLRAAQDTSVVVVLEEEGAELEAVVVTATRGERRVEDTPLRVEVVDEEEVAEKVAMTPGDVTMMLNETSGLRVQPSNPSLGGASVRVQGLRGRYSLVLADGLPLYGAAGGFGLLQIPPVDLARVEIIKGTASALYGGAALGGVINFVSRRPSDEAARTVLVNQTSRGGSDGVFFGTGPLSERWGYTMLAGAHRQSRQDVDDDRWADLPGYERGVVRPRLYFDDRQGRTAFLTGGFTAEDRTGGTLEGLRPAAAPGPADFIESIRTRRGDVGGLARWVIPDTGANGERRLLRGAIATVRGAMVEQRHRHRFGTVAERDRHRTGFAEAALAVPRGRGTGVLGAAFESETYRNTDVAGFDYRYRVPAAFAQLDVDPAPWLAISTSARVDAHSVHGTTVNPRVSVLARRGAEGVLAGWTTRLSAGTGYSAPTPFTDETDATGLTPVQPPGAAGGRALVAERARSVSLDVGGPLRTAMGRLELHATGFGSRIHGALLTRDALPAPGDVVTRLALANAALPTVTWGADLFARLRIEDVLAGELGLLATYVHMHSTEEDPELGVRRTAPLTPRHTAGFDAIWEREGRGRVGLELFYTGRQTLDDNPYRTRSEPYLLVGLLGEWRVRRLGNARVFVNGENLGGVRQTRFDPLVLPARGQGGRWTTDAWTELAGATINAGVRTEF